jgi:hypothetical protein
LKIEEPGDEVGLPDLILRGHRWSHGAIIERVWIGLILQASNRLGRKHRNHIGPIDPTGRQVTGNSSTLEHLDRLILADANACIAIKNAPFHHHNGPPSRKNNMQ